VSPFESERYSRQILYRPIGERGQRRLAQSRVAIVGCGALGTHQAASLARAGVGELVIVDRDYVEESNLQRQCLFDEHDAVECIPKALAAESHLKASNSAVSVRGVVADFGAQNASQLLSGADLVLDGTDNFETRYLINDLSVRDAFPWIYGAAVGSYGATMTIVPGSGACLACVFPEQPAGLQPTCDTEGILSATASAVAAIQVAESLKLLVGDTEALHRKLITFDLWQNRFQAIDPGLPDERCRACGRREFTYLNQTGSAPVRLCGRNSVQIHEDRGPLDFAELERRLKDHGSVRSNTFVMRFSVSDYEMTIFPDGRAIIKGTEDTAVARSLYERYVSPALAAGRK
jgi:molybdopterin/thiamine biosynthesis adenylyltransferase